MRRFGSQLREVELGRLNIEVMDQPGLYYTAHHEWAEIVGGCPCMEEMIRIGVGDYVYKNYGKPRSLRCEEGLVGSRVQQGEKLGDLDLEMGTVAVLAPIEGYVVAINRRFQEQPDLVVGNPYHDGWIAYIRPVGALREVLGELLQPEEYLNRLKTIREEGA